MASSSSENVVVETVVEKKTKKGKSAKNVEVPISNTENDLASSSNINQIDVKNLTNLIAELAKRVETLETELQSMKQNQPVVASTSVKPKKEEKEKKTRPPTAYNNFMREKMLELKESHPSLTNIERMKMAAEAWSESKK